MGIYPDIQEVPRPNPSARLEKFENTDFEVIENTLINAVRHLSTYEVQ